MLEVAEGLLKQKKFTVAYSSEICSVLTTLVSSLNLRIDIFNKKANEIFDFIASLPGFAPASF